MSGTGSAKGGLLLKGTDHKKRVSVKLANNGKEDPESGGVEMVEERVRQEANKNERRAAHEDNNIDEDDDAARGGIGPQGHWRKKLCECTQVIGCTSFCCIGFCCNIILQAQLMTRLGLNWCGIPKPAEAAGTFALVIILYFSYWASLIMVFGVLLSPCVLFWVWAIYTRTRYETRRYFQIPADYCACANGAVEDCLITTFCPCCSTIQIARHTHDENRYKYKFSEPTGLGEEAPPLYEDMPDSRD